ncbi:hypothetical protein AB5I41_17480 [Sphingomonas sp. MMS24-JH45]
MDYIPNGVEERPDRPPTRLAEKALEARRCVLSSPRPGAREAGPQR